MKKYVVFILTLTFALLWVGCNKNAPQDALPSSAATSEVVESIIQEEGQLYVVLPISKAKISVGDAFVPYLYGLDEALLKAAEEKIGEETSQYTDTPSFYLDTDDEGYLMLCAEVVYEIPTVEWCGVDHGSLFFKERISK